MDTFIHRKLNSDSGDDLSAQYLYLVQWMCHCVRCSGVVITHFLNIMPFLILVHVFITSMQH